MRQSQKVRPHAQGRETQDASLFTPQHTSPLPLGKRPKQEKSAPLDNIVQLPVVTKGKAEPKLENGIEEKKSDDAADSEEEYKSVPVSCIYSAAANGQKAVKVPAPTSRSGSTSERSRSLLRTRQPSSESELPLTQDTLKNPSSRPSFESQKVVFPWFVSKINLESCIPAIEESTGGGLMKESIRARGILMSKDVSPAILEIAKSVPIKYPLLDLSEQDLRDEDIADILRVLEVYPFATRLDLYGNKLAFSNCHNVVFGNSSAAIQRLCLSKNRLGPVGPGCMLGRFLTTFQGLHTLELDGCELSDDDLFRLGADISAIRSLKHLSLRANRITNDFSMILGQILDANASIETVDFTLTNVTAVIKKTLGRHKSKLIVDSSTRCCGSCQVI